MNCKLCMQKKPLIKAHIIPQFFFEENSYLVKMDTYPKRLPIGFYDKILCGDCDNNQIGKKFDVHAKKILFDRIGVIPKTEYDSNGIFTTYSLNDKDSYDTMIRFFISVVWRASVSSREEFKGIDLGPLEIIAKNAIQDPSYDYSKTFEISLFYFNDLTHMTTIIPPKRVKLDQVNFYILSLGYFKTYIKCDSRPYPKSCSSLMISAENDLLMIEDKASSHDEYIILSEMAGKLKHRLNRNKATPVPLLPVT